MTDAIYRALKRALIDVEPNGETARQYKHILKCIYAGWAEENHIDPKADISKETIQKFSDCVPIRRSSEGLTQT